MREAIVSPISLEKSGISTGNTSNISSPTSRDDTARHPEERSALSVTGLSAATQNPPVESRISTAGETTCPNSECTRNTGRQKNCPKSMDSAMQMERVKGCAIHAALPLNGDIREFPEVNTPWRTSSHLRTRQLHLKCFGKLRHNLRHKASDR